MTTDRWHRNAAQLRLTVVATLVTVIATLSLSPLFDGRTWLAESLLAVFAIGIVGAVGRYVGVPRVRVALLQLVALALLVTWRFVPEDATLGFVPSPTSIRALVDLASEGVSSINRQVVPVTDVPGIVLLTVLGLGLVALEVDLTAVACRCPAITGVVLLLVYGVTVAAMAPERTSWFWFCAGAAAWLLLLVTGRREALREWADIVDEGRDGRGPSWTGTDPALALGWRVGSVAIVAALAVAALTPGVGDGVLDRIDGASGSEGPAASGPVRLDLTATIKRNLQEPRETELLRYNSLDDRPEYLRLAVLDRFEGVAWKPARLPADAPSVADGSQSVPGLDPTRGTVDRVDTAIITFGAARSLRYLPAPYTPVAVSGVSNDWLWDTDTSTIFSRDEDLGRVSYGVQAETLTVRGEELAQQDGAAAAPPADLVVPEGLPSTLASFAAGATAGAATDYAKAVQLQGWFRSNFRYSLDTDPTDSADAITSFLTARTGYCQQFAATYALMARSVGLASRVVVGFTPGRAGTDGWYTVTTKDYHAWPEVWFDGVGWVRFEPTPRADNASRIDVPSWTLPGPFAPLPSEQATTNESSAPTPSASAGPTRQPRAEGELATAPALSVRERLQPFVMAGLLVLVIVLAAAPGTTRAWRRRRRLDLPAGGPGTEAAWAELEDTARDLGVPWPQSDTPRRTADALVHTAGLTGPAADAVQDLRRGVELTRYAGRGADVARDTSPADAVRTVRRSLLASSSTGDRLRALLVPRTAWRRRR